MATRTKVGGYNDAAALHRAVRHSRAMVEIGHRLVDESPQELLPLVGKLGYFLADQRDALAEMEQIRVKRRNNV